MKGVMPLPTFASWVQKQQVKLPEADRLLPLIAQAGQQGINRGQIGNVIGLERDVLDELLDGLVRFGQLRLDIENGLRVYRAAV